MDLHHLHCFALLAEELHVTRAAQRLQMAQPSLTRIIQHMEAELGFALFDRSKQRHIALTPARRAFLDEILPLLSQYEHAVQAARRISQGERRTLGVGYTAAAIFSGLPAMLQGQTSHSTGEVLLRDVSTLSRRTVLTMLLEHRLDVAFLPSLAQESALSHEKVSTASLVVALPNKHPLANLETLPLAVLSNEAWIAIPRHLNPQWHDDMAQLFQHAGFEPRVVQMASQVHVMVSLVAAGIGIAVVTTWTQQGMAHPGVVYRPLGDSTYQVELHLLWRKNDPSSLVQTFLQTVREGVWRSREASSPERS